MSSTPKSFFAIRRQFVLCLLALVVIGSFALQPWAAEPKDAVQVLFIGNSFTYYHDLPKMVGELAQAGKQRPLVFQTEVPGGYTLERHWNEGKALAAVQAK